VLIDFLGFVCHEGHAQREKGFSVRNSPSPQTPIVVDLSGEADDGMPLSVRPQNLDSGNEDYDFDAAQRKYGDLGGNIGVYVADLHQGGSVEPQKHDALHGEKDHLEKASVVNCVLFYQKTHRTI